MAILAALAACTSSGGGAAQQTVTVTAPASKAPASASPAGSPSGTPSAGGRPGILAVTTAGALVRIDPTTGDIQQTLVASGVLGDEISVSPDRSTVYYAQRSGCATEVKSISTAGGTPASIAPGSVPAISPDGTKLAFAQQPVLTDAGCMPNQANLAILFKVDIRTLPAGGDNVLAMAPLDSIDRETLKQKSAAVQERYKFRFDVAKLAIESRIELPKEPRGEVLTDDFAPANVFDAYGRRYRRKD